MKKLTFVLIMILSLPAVQAQLQLKAPSLKWDETYSFDKCNEFRMLFYAKNQELMRTMTYKTYYQTSGDNFLVKLVTDGRGNEMQTVLDKKNEVAVQIMGGGGSTEPFYNAGGFKYPDEANLKKLDLVPTSETKEILGFVCKKYTYTYKKIFGEVWITDQIDLSNDIGIFRAAKMAALHNTLSVGGFVMEMTTEDAKGGKTLMQTVSLKNQENYKLDLKGVKMNTAINKVNYFTF
ncbi:MAG: hypothetical protein WC384_10410 [Prolixibacteraceae bacterium]